MENKHWKLFVIRQSGANLCPYTMHQNTFGGWATPGPARELTRSPGPLATMREPTSKEREEKKEGRRRTILPAEIFTITLPLRGHPSQNPPILLDYQLSP